MEKTPDPPVTVLVTRRPKPGKEQAFEDYLTGITQAALQHQGHMGANIFRPSRPGGEYRIVFKFDRRSNLERWENSTEREEWRAIAEEVSEPRQVETISGLEAWFTLPTCAMNVHPPKYKMALLVWLGVFCLVTLLSGLLGPLISEFPRLLQTFILTALVVVCLTYAVMPLLTRLFSGWLYPNKDQN
ncbi:antibiotic biosynthesis monooxygenase [Candidatus Thiodiazotropha sp. CDECU1]|uniref:antibiotic biosynthesis monooxygenase n=1 Tax=Candidatus Thiodiazotropha sp. CDECU1 TaxID=3065865 RepID=UPI00292DD8BD|nr:antibiotic biosynthesis monooxygenase [Candidatus Thiodiazotropha sp. CDECU1]